jgi:hypothetical protein
MPSVNSMIVAARRRRLAVCFAILLPALTASAVADSPVGIYSLGQARNPTSTPGDDRLAGIRDYDFVSGFTLRLFWYDLEPTLGQYNFTVIDEAIKRLAPLGQSLSVEVFTNNEPQYVLDAASATYLDHRGGANPVPWDAFAKERHAALYAALGAHIVTGAGAPHPLSLDGTLKSIDAAPAGLNFGVRDLNNGIISHPQYTQQRYIDAVADGVAAAATAFPFDTNFLAFFSFDDGAPGAHVDDQLIARLAPLYNGPGQPPLAFFAENLSDEWPVPLSNGNGMGNNFQDWAAEGGATMMQALDSWLDHPATRDEQLASLNPATGIELAYQHYGTRFFELYLPDLDGAIEGALDAAGRPLVDDLRAWNELLIASPSPDLEADFNQDDSVDAIDLAQWRAGFGQPTGATNLQGDADGDQDVDGADFLMWQRQHGNASDTGLGAIAEPSSLALAVLMTMTSALFRSRTAGQIPPAQFRALRRF